jgi:hypothetical protein
MINEPQQHSITWMPLGNEHRPKDATRNLVLDQMRHELADAAAQLSTS